MNYWTPRKYHLNFAATCVVCHKKFAAGFTDINGEFYCKADKNIKDVHDINIFRVSFWREDNVPPVIQYEIIPLIDPNTNMAKVVWVGLFDLDTIDIQEQLTNNFVVLQEINTSKGLVVLLGEKPEKGA